GAERERTGGLARRARPGLDESAGIHWHPQSIAAPPAEPRPRDGLQRALQDHQVVTMDHFVEALVAQALLDLLCLRPTDLAELGRVEVHDPARELPPTEMGSPRSRASRAISSVTASTVSSLRAPVFTLGSSVESPSTSVRSTSRSASISEATSALRLSLSPTLISSTATVSFSLTIGRTQNCS